MLINKFCMQKILVFLSIMCVFWIDLKRWYNPIWYGTLCILISKDVQLQRVELPNILINKLEDDIADLLQIYISCFSAVDAPPQPQVDGTAPTFSKKPTIRQVFWINLYIPFYLSIHLPMYWFIDLFIYSLIDVLIYWFIDFLIYWFIDLLIFWFVNIIDLLIY